ncbi:MAG: formate dehydrogenase major subunit [Acidimicrobiia bacterium]|nr:formate dehydrogenase major subunit [Acidimicrobiia bacterium]
MGRGGATTFQQDLSQSDLIVIMGSNMAECHPVGFQWVVEAQQRGGRLIHIDPRFSRTSALADEYVPLRAGSDIAFLGGLIRYIIENHRWFHDYVVNYTNAATILRDDFADTEDLDGVFSGWDPAKRSYDATTWQYAGMDVAPSAGQRDTEAAVGETHGSGGAQLEHGNPPQQDPTLQHPRCVFQVLRRHYARYTPEMVEEVCGVPREQFVRVAQMLCDNSGPDRTSALCYAVGWTQHTVGVQIIRAASIVQLLLGNIGRPGGGILALRGHASIQGSTDIPTLYDLLPGYLPMPHAGHYENLAGYIKHNSAPAGFWAYMGAYAVSLLKAYFGDRATRENEFCFDYLPRISGDHSIYRGIFDMLDDKVEGFLVIGENPAVGNANSRAHRLAMAHLKWLVVRDLQDIETASFWRDSPEVESGELRTEEIPTEVFLMPAAAHTEKSGTFTNTQRLLQWRDQAVEPPGDARSDLWFAFHLGQIIRAKLADSTEQRDRPILDLAWDYPTRGPLADPDAEAVLAEISGYDSARRHISGYVDLKDDGSTTCGCWIYCGCFADGVNQTRRRKPGRQQDWVAAEWGWAWPANRRMLYNRASADPSGRPWSERKRYVWWDAEAGRWTGYDVPDFKPTMSPDYTPTEGSTGPDALSGTEPFIMQSDGRGWLFAPAGVRDGPLPTHYEPHESPCTNPLYGIQANPTRQLFPRPENRYHASDGEPGAEDYPYVFTTYRLTEHHTAGGMSRWVWPLVELQPEMFCEVSPALASERGLVHGDWATLLTARTCIEARVMVTDRMVPLRVEGRLVHQIGLPFHWGSRGLAVGDSANDLASIVLDPNVHIQEVKAATCDIRPGRRPRGPRSTSSPAAQVRTTEERA